MRRTNIAFFLGLMAFTLCLGAFGPASAAASSQAKSETAEEAPPLEDPRQIVKVLQKAIDTRNAELADSRIDFNKVGVIFLSSAMPQINERIAAGELTLPQPLPALMGSLNASSASTRRPAQLFLCAEMRKLVLYGVASGYFAGKVRPQSELASLDGGLFLNFAKLKPGRQKFGPAVLAAQDEVSALVLTSLTDGGSGKTYELELLLARDDNYWVVFSVENAVELFEQIMAGQD